jgi:hypothetical protein
LSWAIVSCIVSTSSVVRTRANASSSISMTNSPFLPHLGSLVSNGAPGRTSAKMRSWGSGILASSSTRDSGCALNPLIG